MTHPYTLARLRQQSAIQQFHADFEGAAGRSVTSFDHADVTAAVVAKPDTRGKAGLCEPGPLADSFEFCGGHSTISSQLVVSIEPELTLGVELGGGGVLIAQALNPFVEVTQVLVAHDVGFHNRSPAVGSPKFGDALRHFHSPVSGGALLRCTRDRNIVPVCQAANAPAPNLFHTLAYRA